MAFRGAGSLRASLKPLTLASVRPRSPCLLPRCRCTVSVVGGTRRRSEAQEDDIDDTAPDFPNRRIARVERRTWHEVLQPGTREVDEPGSDW